MQSQNDIKLHYILIQIEEFMKNKPTKLVVYKYILKRRVGSDTAGIPASALCLMPSDNVVLFPGYHKYKSIASEPRQTLSLCVAI